MPELFAPNPDDPDARYLLELDHLVVAIFSAGSGLRPEREITEVEEGGRAFAVARIGPYAKGHIVLERGETDDPTLFRWFVRSRDADAFASCRRSGAVIYVDGEGAERMRWRFRNARITEWYGPPEPPGPGEVYWIERVGISHEGLEPRPTGSD